MAAVWIVAIWIVAAFVVPNALALDPRKSLTQYSRTIWTQERGLPQDTIRAIAQTKEIGRASCRERG